MIGLQAAINMAVVTGLLPVTGITLPLVSYGGSSLIFTMLGVGVLLNISRYAGK
jgi:cell division protein FtsW